MAYLGVPFPFLHYLLAISKLISSGSIQYDKYLLSAYCVHILRNLTFQIFIVWEQSS